VLELFRQEPDLAEINRGVSHQDYRDVDSR
jgi:hypothetical protein